MFRVTLPRNSSRAMGPVPRGLPRDRANVDIGISCEERDGLVRIEDERPGACLIFDGIERAGSLQCRQAGFRIEGKRNIPGPR